MTTIKDPVEEAVFAEERAQVLSLRDGKWPFVCRRVLDGPEASDFVMAATAKYFGSAHEHAHPAESARRGMRLLAELIERGVVEVRDVE